MAQLNIEKMAQNVVQKIKEEGVFIGRWIPVSERLPEEGGEYLITWTGVLDGFKKRSKPIISTTEYEIFEPDNYADWITNIPS